MLKLISLVTGMISLSVMLLLTAIMTSIWIRFNKNLHDSDINSLSRFQKFIISFYGQLVKLEILAICILGTYALFNFKRFYSFSILGMAALILVLARVLANTKLLPINRQVMTWTSDYIPGKWRYLIGRWFFFHKLRTFFCFVALLFVFIACFQMIS